MKKSNLLWLWAVVPVLFAVAIAVADPTMLQFLEFRVTFFWDSIFIKSSLCQIGGLSFFLSAFLTQFFAVKGLGLAIVAVLLACGAYLLCRSRIPDPLAVITLLPIPVLFTSVEDVMPYLVALVFLCIGIALAYKNTCWLFRLASGVALYVCCGSIAISYGVAVLIMYLVSARKNIWKGMGILVAIVLCGILAVKLALVEDWSKAFGPALYYHVGADIPFAAYLAMALPVVYVFLKGIVNTDKKAVMVSLWAACALGIAALAVFHPAKDVAVYKQVAVCAVKGESSKVLSLCRKHKDILATSEMLQDYQYAALAKSDKLKDWIFTQKEFHVQTMIMQSDRSPYVGSLLADVYYNCGLVAISQKHAFEANENFGGYSPSNLLLLVRTNINLGYEDVARKYIRLLSKTAFYRKEALDFEKYLDGEKKQAKMEAMKCYGELNNWFCGSRSLLSELRASLACNGKNKFAIQYAIAEAMLTDNKDAFNKIIAQYGDNL